MWTPWLEKLPWRRKCQPTPGFLPGKSHGQRRLEGYSPWGHNESDMAEHVPSTPRLPLGSLEKAFSPRARRPSPGPSRLRAHGGAPRATSPQLGGRGLRYR